MRHRMIFVWLTAIAVCACLFGVSQTAAYARTHECGGAPASSVIISAIRYHPGIKKGAKAVFPHSSDLSSDAKSAEENLLARMQREYQTNEYFVLYISGGLCVAAVVILIVSLIKYRRKGQHEEGTAARQMRADLSENVKRDPQKAQKQDTDNRANDTRANRNRNKKAR